MPVYEYNCESCGPFNVFRPFSESGAPTDCPECGEIAEKVFPVVHLSAMRPENRKAWERNEKSAHAPHVCHSGCSHRGIKPKATKQAEKPALQFSTKANSRPWMLGH